ncbi:hypothetical protein D070_13350 [Bacillus velezensis]|uniref:hypothetical protein n=1 Tax=Bacillus velezensis TaxID=492670 RepID=UPI0011295E66|nr:hypothetical protein [Bacillus velezensis]QDF49563.1 hypothetical protein FIM06_2501 [Bacillus velezensis]QDF53209.1 hypothetical protein D069_2500 [Bacillus velezensis]
MDWFSDEAKRAKSEYDRILRRNIDNMAKEIVNANAKIHVLADETLGGIKREYAEVDRKAEVGEKIVIVEKADFEEGYENGDVFTVDRHRPGKSHVESDEARCGGNINGFILREEYHVLEPTDIVHIDGQRYEMVDREAEVGERIIIVRPDEGMGNAKEAGIVGTVGSLYSAGDVCVKNIGLVLGTEYRVLVPVEAVEDEPQPADPIDVIASLAQEVASLKRTVDRHRDEIDTLHKDNRTLGEELERLKEPKETEETAPIEAPLVFVQRKIGDAFDVYQDGKKLRGIRHIRIDAAEGEFTTHDIEFVSGATEEERP